MKPSFVAVACLSLFAGCRIVKIELHDPVQSAQAFEMLKSLAGKWRGTTTATDHPGDVNLTYELVSGGSAVMERLNVGTPAEMVSIYHLDGERLLMTHYCVLGNQPRMELDSFIQSPETMASFSFRDATNWKGPDQVIMHNVRLYLIGKDHLGADWVAWVNGKADHTSNFDFQRVR